MHHLSSEFGDACKPVTFLRVKELRPAIFFGVWALLPDLSNLQLALVSQSPFLEMVDIRCPSSPSKVLGLKANISKGLGFLRSSHHFPPVGPVFSGPLPRIRTNHDLDQSCEPLTSSVVSVLPRFVGFGTNHL